jgi:hypothetical protein
MSEVFNSPLEKGRVGISDGRGVFDRLAKQTICRSKEKTLTQKPLEILILIQNISGTAR